MLAISVAIWRNLGSWAVMAIWMAVGVRLRRGKNRNRQAWFRFRYLRKAMAASMRVYLAKLTITVTFHGLRQSVPCSVVTRVGRTVCAPRVAKRIARSPTMPECRNRSPHSPSPPTVETGQQGTREPGRNRSCASTRMPPIEDTAALTAPRAINCRAASRIAARFLSRRPKSASASSWLSFTNAGCEERVVHRARAASCREKRATQRHALRGSVIHTGLGGLRAGGCRK